MSNTNIDIDAFAVIDQVSRHTTFDDLAARDPNTLDRQKRECMMAFQRAERAAWQLKQAKKKEKKDE